MNTLHDHILRKLQIRMRKIPDRLHAVGCHQLRHGFRLVSGQRQSCDLHIIFFQIPRKLTHHTDRNIPHHGPVKFRVHIKNSNHLKSPAGKFRIICQCLSQVTCAENDHIVGTVQSQNLSNFRMQMLYVVAVALLAEAAEIVQILPDL